MRPRNYLDHCLAIPEEFSDVNPTYAITKESVYELSDYWTWEVSVPSSSDFMKILVSLDSSQITKTIFFKHHSATSTAQCWRVEVLEGKYFILHMGICWMTTLQVLSGDYPQISKPTCYYNSFAHSINQLHKQT